MLTFPSLFFLLARIFHDFGAGLNDGNAPCGHVPGGVANLEINQMLRWFLFFRDSFALSKDLAVITFSFRVFFVSLYAPLF